MRGFRALVPVVVWNELRGTGIRRDFKANETLLVEGAPDTSLLVLQRGRVRVLNSTLLVAVRGSGDVLGEMSAQDGGTRSATVVAMESCVAFSLSRAAFKRVLERHKVGDQLGQYVVAKLRETVTEVSSRGTEARVRDVLERIARLAETDHPKPLTIPLSQSKLAESLGLSRNAVAKVLVQLCDQNYLASTNPICLAE
ncbi:Crp/Fnr family transcriptional regulator [Lentzea flaviverrucosa]|uniref:Crp/Fnr family transcriptional regulator n=1 Tax=Lentzea flaviverrucosa TaxID=200379 RepID=UPI000B7C9950|nr:Crp/Fnr family transcriptional regulator [Lentzea flaviverrucosa]